MKRARWLAAVVLAGGAGVAAWQASARVPGSDGEASVAARASGTSAADARLWNAVEQHLRLADVYGPGAQANYTTSLEGLKRQSAAVTEVAIEAFTRAPSRAHELRYGLLFLVTELREPRSEDFLMRVAESNEHSFTPAKLGHDTSIDPEVILRATAIRGLVKLAASGSPSTTERLIRLAVQHPSGSTRVAAVHELRLGFPGDPGVRAALEASVRPSDRFALADREPGPARP
jgi:hypothetical protein